MDKKQLAEINQIVSKFVVELEKRGIHPEEVILYGSHARGNATKDSDIDLVVISNDFAKIHPQSV